MEIKAILQKPFSEKEKLNFIVEYNHNQGLEIKETTEALEAWGYAQEEQALEKQKELAEYNYKQKAKKAYGGILINNTYLFETNQASQSMITASLIGLQNAPDEITLNWKVYMGDIPLVVPVTKAQLVQLFAFAINMVNTSFDIEGERNQELAKATIEQLNNVKWVEEFKNATNLAFANVNNKVDIVLVSQNYGEEPTEDIPSENV